MKRIIKIIIVPLIAMILSIGLDAFSETKVFDYFVLNSFKLDANSLQEAKGITKCIAFVLIVFPIGYQAIVQGYFADKAKRIKGNFGEKQRESIVSLLISRKCTNEELGKEDINIRVFKKKWGRLISNDIDGFCARRINRRISFSIKKKEGLVSRCYDEKRTMLEKENGGKDEYNLSLYNKSAVSELRFIVAVPICNVDGGRVKFIICFDSFKQIGIDPGKNDLLLKICETAAYDINEVLN